MSHILIVDDQQDNRYYLEMLLKGNGHSVACASNGAEALAIAHQRVPQLVIADLLMPVMDGFTLLRNWKKDSQLKLVPFVVYTATYTGPEDQQLAMQLGADAFILKPAEPEDLMARLAQVQSRSSHSMPATHVAIGDEQHLLVLYNETLIRKLEQKSLQLEEANSALHKELLERQQVESALRRSEASLQTAQQVANIGSWETDIATGIVNWSAQTHRIFGTDPSTALASHLNFLQLVHPDDRQRVDQAFQQSFTETSPQIIEHRLLQATGTIKYIEERWQVFHDENGNPLRALGTCRDITEHKMAEMEIRRTSELLRAVTDGTSDAVFVKDLQGRYLMFNEGAARLVGRSISEVLGNDDSALFGPDEVNMIRANDRRVMSENQVQTCEELLTANGIKRTFLALKAPYRDEHGNVIGMIGISRDISERRAMELKLRQTLQDLDHRNRVLRDFAFVASHDLREPLRKIRAFADILVSRYGAEVPAPAHDYLQRMNHTAARMQVLIDDVLTYSRVSGGRSTIQMVDLNNICQETLTDLEEAILRSQAQVTVGALSRIAADATQMRQLFQNLLSNSLKFRAPGRTAQIEVSCAPADLEGEPGICISFNDNGIGFASEFAERIFDPFQRLHARNEFDGTGIGLAIVYRIVERHHGHIKAEGRPGEGSCIRITLPMAQPPENDTSTLI